MYVQMYKFHFFVLDICYSEMDYFKKLKNYFFIVHFQLNYHYLISENMTTYQQEEEYLYKDDDTEEGRVVTKPIFQTPLLNRNDNYAYLERKKKIKFFCELAIIGGIISIISIIGVIHRNQLTF